MENFFLIVITENLWNKSFCEKLLCFFVESGSNFLITALIEKQFE